MSLLKLRCVSARFSPAGDATGCDLGEYSFFRGQENKEACTGARAEACGLYKPEPVEDALERENQGVIIIEEAALTWAGPCGDDGELKRPGGATRQK